MKTNGRNQKRVDGMRPFLATLSPFAALELYAAIAPYGPKRSVLKWSE